jgi:hypothetical protein
MFSWKKNDEVEFVEGLEFPTTLAEYEQLAEKTFQELLSLESEGTDQGKGWVPIDHGYDPTILVFEKPIRGSISIIKLETILPASPKVTNIVLIFLTNFKLTTKLFNQRFCCRKWLTFYGVLI